jgi:hypothetical protein
LRDLGLDGRIFNFDFKGMKCENAEWNNVAQNIGLWLALMNTLMTQVIP